MAIPYMAIRIFVTGGTFDKEYDELHGRLFFKDTHIGEMLRLGRSHVDVSVRTLMMIDSLEMSDADRELIVLARYHDLPCERIAEVLDCTGGAARVRLHRAIGKLRAIYERLEREEHELPNRT